ncbi:nucleoside transporter C-terminal domain-containing protein [Tistrella bauzanensis]|uniref:Nucleoside transporter C-terminal domain-containing protein n=1 Tax=Tistrella arctica TaxID=3133430 RepID=A0ABU9YDV7_9PROT
MTGGALAGVAQSGLGLLLLVALAWIIGRMPRGVPWRAVGIGLVVQVVIALVLLKLPPVQLAFVWANRGVSALEAATRAGTSVVFGYLGGGAPPFDAVTPANSFVLAFQGLPLILVIGAIAGLLYHWRVIPLFVRLFARLLRRSFGVGGAVGVSTAANVFVGMVEAPLFVRPYLARLTNPELFMVMTAGLSTLAGNMMVLYAVFLTGVIDDPIGQLLTASLISAPAALVVAMVMMPAMPVATPDGVLAEDVDAPPSEASSSLEAAVVGVLNGVNLLINVVAMLIAGIALAALANMVLGLGGDIGGAPLTLERMLGWIMAPIAWAMGMSWTEALAAAPLLGTKVVVNELVAFLNFAADPSAFSPRSRLILTYALSSFANIGSLGIMIGGMIAMVPERRADIVRLAPLSLVSGTIATCMTGAVVGLVM